MKNKTQLLCVITAAVLYLSGLSMLFGYITDSVWTVSVQLNQVVEEMETAL